MQSTSFYYDKGSGVPIFFYCICQTIFFFIYYLQAHIIALDKSEQKVAKIKQTCETQGVSCVNTYVYDARKCHSDITGDLTGPPFPSNCFDKVLLDAPCSGLGQRPQLGDCKMSPNMLQSYKFVQRKLFDAVSMKYKTTSLA